MELDEEIKALQQARAASASSASRVGLGSAGVHFDQELYGGSGSNFVAALPTDAEERALRAGAASASASGGGGGGGGSRSKASRSKRSSVEASRDLLRAPDQDSGVDPMAAYRESHGSGLVNTRISDRESEYHARHRQRGTILSPERGDAFSGETPARSYKDTRREQLLDNDIDQMKRALAKRAEEDAEIAASAPAAVSSSSSASAAAAEPPRKRKKRRWDDGAPAASSSSSGGGGKAVSQWDAVDGGASGGASDAATPMLSGGGGAMPTPARSRWDATPAASIGVDATPAAGGATTSKWDATPAAGGARASVSKWDATPSGVGETPSRKRSRWDETPQAMDGATPSGAVGATPVGGMGATPMGAAGMMTPAYGGAISAQTAEERKRSEHELDIEIRNRPLTDDELDAIFPPEGYKIIVPPSGYVPITPSRALLATPTPQMGTPMGFFMGATPSRDAYGVELGAADGDPSMPSIKPEDMQYFGKLMEEADEETMSSEEAKERMIMRLLLKIKNGTPPQRKTAMRQITDKARDFGAGPLFNQVLPLLMSPTLEDQERHLLVKVIDRVLYKLDDRVRPYVHKILVVIEPLLIDEDYYARVEGREIISNLAKAAGLATMIATMRADIDNLDEYVRNTTSRAFAVVASALGVPSLLPFLKAVCQSRLSWQARHTGIKICQQIAILMGCAILPHLNHLVEIIAHGLTDEQQKVRTIAALALSAYAEAAHPYGIESFDVVLRPLWRGIRKHSGKGLAAFLKAIGFIIPLMDANYASYYTTEVMGILIREFQTADEEMKKIVLKVVEQCVATDGVEPEYIKEDILPEFFRCFWVRRIALDRRNYRALVATTVEIANKVGLLEVVSRIVDDLKDESEPYRKMVMDTIDKVVQNLGAADIGERLEEQLVDGILYAFQEQTEDESPVMLNGFATVINALGVRAKPYLPQVCGTIKWRLNNPRAKVRMQAADLISRVAVVMMTCGEEKLLAHLGVVLYEYLGEEYPDVLGSILGGLKAIVNVIGMGNMTPSISELLPRLTPVLKNRHEKVQENCIDLVGRIADRGAEFVSPKEWMRICFELLDMLKARKKSIRRAAVNTFGYIAKAIGPQVSDLFFTIILTTPLPLPIARERSHSLLTTHSFVCLYLLSLHTTCTIFSGRTAHAAQQPEGAGSAEPRVHDRCDRNRRGDVLPLHDPPSADE